MKKVILSVFALALTNSYANEVIGDSYWGNTTNSVVEREKAEKPYIPPKIESFSASNLKNLSKDETKMSKPRQDAIKSGALMYGTQVGYANRAYEINLSLKDGKRKIQNPQTGRIEVKDLDKIFDFNLVMLEPGLLAPIFAEINDVYHQANENEVRYAKKLYKIIEPARIVTYVPTWRDYLELPVEKVEKVSKALYPKNKEEQALWDEYLEYGNKEGIEQANEAYEGNIARLTRDYNGMLVYLITYGKGRTTSPQLQRTQLGVTGGGDQMNVDDSVIRKTQDAQLVPNKKQWLYK